MGGRGEGGGSGFSSNCFINLDQNKYFTRPQVGGGGWGGGVGGMWGGVYAFTFIPEKYFFILMYILYWVSFSNFFIWNLQNQKGSLFPPPSIILFYSKVIRPPYPTHSQLGTFSGGGGHSQQFIPTVFLILKKT